MFHKLYVRFNWSRGYPKLKLLEIYCGHILYTYVVFICELGNIAMSECAKVNLEYGCNVYYIAHNSACISFHYLVQRRGNYVIRSVCARLSRRKVSRRRECKRTWLFSTGAPEPSWVGLVANIFIFCPVKTNV